MPIYRNGSKLIHDRQTTVLTWIGAAHKLMDSIDACRCFNYENLLTHDRHRQTNPP
jgi:hypothetical protein